uniref:Uncharacterized protein LOC117352214 isoform X2 n=1 Tax=Geotrypetes seraphini TaxID=260995 RepID=A0A6P8PR79_GEOSA|nr:uncharacterized protein LOC117352214 isoform X2 [Geotrypetes seraphini]
MMQGSSRSGSSFLLPHLSMLVLNYLTLGRSQNVSEATGEPYRGQNISLFQVPITYQDRMSFARAALACDTVGQGLATWFQANFSYYQNNFRSSGWSWVQTTAAIGLGNCTKNFFQYANTSAATDVLCKRNQDVFARKIQNSSLLEFSDVCEKEQAKILRINDCADLLAANITAFNSYSVYLIATGILVNLGLEFRTKTTPDLTSANFALCIDSYNVSQSAPLSAGKVPDVFIAPVQFSFGDAVKYCRYHNTIVATREQVSEMMKSGFESCSWGWTVSGQGILMFNETASSYSNANLFEDMEQKLLYPACILKGNLTFDIQSQDMPNALHKCQSEGLFLSSLEELNKSVTKNQLTPPFMVWVYKAKLVLPRRNANLKCGQGYTGLLSRVENVSTLANVYCYRRPESVRAISLVIIGLVTTFILLFLILITTLLVVFYRRY